MKCKSRPVLRYEITIQSLKTTGQDSYDQLDKTLDTNWETYCVRRGAIRDAGGRERFGEDMTVATTNKVLEMWGDSSTRQISAMHRAKYEDVDGVAHTLHITRKSVSDDTRWVMLYCWEED